jgi:hypothetical protein
VKKLTFYLLLSGLCVQGVLTASPAVAKPDGPKVFCETYPDSGLCEGTLVTCSLCHTSTSPPPNTAWNQYGGAVYGKRTPGADFAKDLPNALLAVEADDSDNDDLDNISEILLGSLPGDALSTPIYPDPPQGEPNPLYNVGGYDANYAFKRVSIVYCGRNPTYEEFQTFKAGSSYDALHAKLDDCLGSAYWRDKAIAHMADPAIRPINFGTNWKWDYRLFRYVMTGGRDMREVLTANYHVREEVPGKLTQLTGVVLTKSSTACKKSVPGTCPADHFCIAPAMLDAGFCAHMDGGQPLAPQHRAGLITSTWFHFFNTMFSALPRQTAAQAYRAWLGFDIARQEGLMPVKNEPLDVDNKGVAQAECAQCHSTLDPMSYPFAYHNGIEGTGASDYDPLRPLKRNLWDPEVPGDTPQGMLMGQPITTLQDWADVAVKSDAFKRQISLVFYRHAIGHPPRPEDLDEFTQLWKTLPKDDYSADQLNHRLIDLNAFGAL